MSVDVVTFPPWKQALMERKRRRLQSDDATPTEGSFDLVDHPTWKRESMLKHQVQHNSIMYFVQPHSNNNIYSSPDISSLPNDKVNSTFSGKKAENGEERLLPIHRNPILLLDLEKRQHIWSGTLATAHSPKAIESPKNGLSPKIADSSTAFTNSELNITSSSASPVPSLVNDINNVFVEEEEVTYGKGFVHRLLQKFSHLSAKDDQIMLPFQKSLRNSNSGITQPVISNKGYNSLPSRKIHSFDNFCQESFQSHDVNSKKLTEKVPAIENVGSTSGCEVRNAVAIEEDAIQTCIDKNPDAETGVCKVSDARTIFESLTFSPTKKNRIEKSPERPVSLNSNKSVNEQARDSKICTKSDEPNRNVSGLKKDSVVDNKTKCNNVNDNQASFIMKNRMNVPQASDNLENINDIKKNNHEPAKSATEAKIPINSPNETKFELNTAKYVWQNMAKHENSNEITRSKESRKLNAPVKPLQPISQNLPKPMSVDVKPSENGNPTKERILGQKPAVARPGKLLIRPASNLVAPNTKSEFFEMTKYNDVKKGEFAPGKTKIYDSENVEDCAADWLDGGNISKVQEITKFEFEGAGVSIGKSMLAKTRNGKKLKISFDDSATTTFEYPSEISMMMEPTPTPSGDRKFGWKSPSPEDNPHSSNILVANHAIASAESLSSYKSTMQVDYEFGMYRNNVANSQPPPGAGESSSNSGINAFISQSKKESETFSNANTSDLLF